MRVVGFLSILLLTTSPLSAQDDWGLPGQPQLPVRDTLAFAQQAADRILDAGWPIQEGGIRMASAEVLHTELTRRDLGDASAFPDPSPPPLSPPLDGYPEQLDPFPIARGYTIEIVPLVRAIQRNGPQLYGHDQPSGLETPRLSVTVLVFDDAADARTYAHQQSEQAFGLDTMRVIELAGRRVVAAEGSALADPALGVATLSAIDLEPGDELREMRLLGVFASSELRAFASWETEGPFYAELTEGLSRVQRLDSKPLMKGARQLGLADRLLAWQGERSFRVKMPAAHAEVHLVDAGGAGAMGATLSELEQIKAYLRSLYRRQVEAPHGWPADQAWSLGQNQVPADQASSELIGTHMFFGIVACDPEPPLLDDPTAFGVEEVLGRAFQQERESSDPITERMR